MGGDPHRNGYLVYVPYLNRITSAYHLSFQERKFLTFTDDGILNKPKNIRPLSDHIPLYDDDDVTDHRVPEHDHDTTDNAVPEMCDHPECNLPKHPDNVPHSYEQRDTRNRGPNPPRKRNSDYVPPNYAEMVVCNQCFTITIMTEDVTE